jgi:hypothetical protein
MKLMASPRDQRDCGAHWTHRCTASRNAGQHFGGETKCDGLRRTGPAHGQYTGLHFNNNGLEGQLSALALEMTPQLKAALEKAAADDARSVASLIQKLTTDYCRERGFLKDAPRKRPR